MALDTIDRYEAVPTLHENLPPPGSLWRWTVETTGAVITLPKKISGLIFVVATNVIDQRMLVLSAVGDDKAKQWSGLHWYSITWWSYIDHELVNGEINDVLCYD